LTRTPRSAVTVFRNIVAAVILVPLAVVIVAFAIANRQFVTVSFDPFSAAQPAASLTLPLFALIILVLILGVVIGGMAGWLRHGGWRRTAKRLEREVAGLRAELDAHNRVAGPPPAPPEAVKQPERLKLQAPLR
jgi:uncharacterized integral membrane protein